MKSLPLVLVFIGASVAYKVDMSYYHPAVLDFILKKAERLLEGLDGHGGKNDPDHHPFIVSWSVLKELRVTTFNIFD